MYPTAFISLIKDALAQELPGVGAQQAMARFGRSSTIPDNFKPAAVLLLLFPKDGDIHFVLTRRTSRYKGDRHSGQISFPGGSAEKSDPDLYFTSARETHEEIGVPMEKITHIGKLTELYIPVSNFLVHPFVGFSERQPIYSPQIEEVEEIIEVPLELLMDPATLQSKDITIQDGLLIKEVPYFNIYDHVVWGATAMMLNEFKTIIEQITPDKS